MTYNPIQAEQEWRHMPSGRRRSIRSEKHLLPHRLIHQALAEALEAAGCKEGDPVLDIGCGSGSDADHFTCITRNITGIDVAADALAGFRARGYTPILADAGRLPFPDSTFHYVVCPAVLHHLVGQGGLEKYLEEFVRVLRPGGYVIALEPNVLHLSGLLMNIANSIRPGITGLVPHERALLPFHLKRVFSKAGLEQVHCAAASYTWNRLPLWVSRLIANAEHPFRDLGPFRYMGWFTIVAGRKLPQVLF